MSEQQHQKDVHRHDGGRRKKRLRRFFLTLGPVVVAVAAAYFYWTGGRYVETDNAYVQADKVTVSAEVSGSIVKVLVEENQYVEEGQPLCLIDSRPYAIALEEAEARLQEAATSIAILKERLHQKESELELAQNNVDFAEKEYLRRLNLKSSQAVATAKLEDAQHAFQVNQHKLAIIRTERQQILAQLEGDPKSSADRLSSYRLAKAMVEKAALDLERTTVRAPFSGRVSKTPEVGKHVSPGTSILSLIADKEFWIEANLKETELTNVQQGQKVDITVDTYPDHRFSGTVQSISPGTGSEFSIIPAQNATGNWVKVVQRVPVRISVDGEDGQWGLRSGLSTTVTIDTLHRRSLPAWIRRGLAFIGVVPRLVAAQDSGQK